jgi:hypothetical protein
MSEIDSRAERRTRFLEKAAQCRQAAASAEDAPTRAEYQRIALEWEQLAQAQDRRQEPRSIHHISRPEPSPHHVSLRN